MKTTQIPRLSIIQEIEMTIKDHEECYNRIWDFFDTQDKNEELALNVIDLTSLLSVITEVEN